MSAALRLVDTFPPPAVTYRPSTFPTLVPSVPSGASEHPTFKPTSATNLCVSESTPPPTQRSATLGPGVDAAARQEAYSLLAVMRMNADFLTSLLTGNDSPVALEALEDLQRGIDRLEQRFALSSPIIPRSR